MLRSRDKTFTDFGGKILSKLPLKYLKSSTIFTWLNLYIKKCLILAKIVLLFLLCLRKDDPGGFEIEVGVFSTGGRQKPASVM